MLTAIVNCKINLGLNIIRKRDDGFHDLQTVFYPTDYFTDQLSLEQIENGFEFVCHSAQNLGPSADNLCVRAYRLLERDFGIQGVVFSSPSVFHGDKRDFFNSPAQYVIKVEKTDLGKKVFSC